MAVDASGFRQPYRGSFRWAARDTSSARFAAMAWFTARLRLGAARDVSDHPVTGAVRHLHRHRRARPRYPFQHALGDPEHGAGLGRSSADHPGLHARLRPDHSAIGDRGHDERDPAVSDGGGGAAADPLAADQAAAPGADRAFHRRDPVGRMLSLPAACAARAPYRLRAWARHRPDGDRADRDHHRVSSRRQSVADLRRRGALADAAGLPVLDPAQRQGACRRARARSRPRAVSSGRPARQRRA